MCSDRDSNVEVERRKLSNGSAASALPQWDQYLSVSDCSGDEALSIVPAVITRNIQNDLSYIERGKKKKRRNSNKLLRSGVFLSPSIAIIFLLGWIPSVVLAQQNDAPTEAPVDSVTPSPTTAFPVITAAPTNRPTTTPTNTPTSTPTSTPTNAPTSMPTNTPTSMPTNTPTSKPTQVPTTSPSISPMPTIAPSGQPSFSPSESFQPTTPAPSAQPTMAIPSLKETKFRQEFQVGNSRQFTEEELIFFQSLYQRYTVDFAPIPASEVEEKITTICKVDKQTILFSSRKRELESDGGWSLRRLRRRKLQDEVELQETNTLNVDYTMSYESMHYNVTQYPKLFQNWTTNNLDVVLDQMQFLKFDIVSVDIPKRIVVSTPSPTVSPAPSSTPTASPTVTPQPSMTSTEESATLAPSVEEKGFESFNIIIISVSLIIAVAIIAIGLFLYYRKRRTKREDTFGPNGSKRNQARDTEPRNNMRWTEGSRGNPPNPQYGTSSTKAYGSSFGRHSDQPSRLADAVSSPPGSLVSSQSLISRGNSMGGDSREEEDAAHTLVDEFDQYKDQNLEKMRAGFEDLPEYDGMMSQAVAKALIDQDDDLFISSSYWGSDQDISASEIEASALGFVLDWLKRNGQVSEREK